MFTREDAHWLSETVRSLYGARTVEELAGTAANPNFRRLRAGGLTTRECEVLHWIAQGKRNPEIATIVGAASTTINKHVGHLLAKLNAETRGGAVRAARHWITSRA